MTRFQTACFCCAELNSLIYCILHYLHTITLDGWFVLSFEFGATVLGLTFETAAATSSCHCQAKFI